MKYCTKCGTLLEDSHEICIACGADMSEPGAWSMYPPEMAKSIETERKQNKSKTGLIAMLIVVFVLLVALISVIVIMNVSKEAESDVTAEDVAAVMEEVAEEAPAKEEVKEEASEPAEEKPVPSGREVKDSEGKYYNVGRLNDAAGNLVFTTIYPEDFSEISTNINYDIYSTRYPECITYVVGNQDGNVRMTYMSPQHYWYRKSTNKKTRSNERDVYDFMQFYTYSGAQGFIETMIKESYTDIKGFKLTGKEEFSPETTAKTEAVSKAQTMYLTGGDIGDYGKIAEDTEYAAMAAEFEAYLYHYEATSRQNNTIYMDFYVPVIANELGYATALDDDQGTIIEWILPEFVAFEAGNEELHNEYMDAFRLFIANSRPTEEFYYINRAYSDEVEAEIASGRDMSVSSINLDTEKMKELHGKYTAGADLGEYGKGIYEINYTLPAAYTSFTGEGDDAGLTVAGLDGSRVAFYGKEKGKVFIATADDNYPGDDYTELKLNERAAAEAASADTQTAAE